VQNGKFVIDTVIHAFNLSEENFAYPRYASAINELILGVTGIVPSGYGLPRDAVIRDWPIEDAANMVFRESHTDVAVYHPVPIFAYKDGQSAFPKGVEAIKRWPNRFIGMYVSLDPLRPGTDAIAELNRQIDEVEAAGQKPLGLKLYPTSWRGEVIDSWRMDDPKIAYPLFEAAAARGITTMAVHKAIPLGPAPTAPAFHPGDVEAAADAYPELNFEIVHGGSAFIEETAWLLGRFQNIYVNLETLTIILASRPRMFAQAVLGLCHVGGAAVLDRLFWSSGAMQFHPRLCLDAFERFSFPDDLLADYGLFDSLPQITDDHKANILALNFVRLNGLDIEALRSRIDADEFAADGGDATPYSTTSIAGEVLTAA
jgi:predicted TIM-barrel fold metal-dependent hydrolase